MASDFKSSFIPKDSATGNVFQKKKVGVMDIVVVSLFVFSIIISGALFVYRHFLKNDIKNLKSELESAERNLDKTAINEMVQFNKKLEVAKSIVYRHQAISGFLDYLASSTVRTISFADFNYSARDQGELIVNMKGEATSYASVALQEDIFSKSKYFKSVTFSNLGLTADGSVSFNVSISVDPQIMQYTASLNNL